MVVSVFLLPPADDDDDDDDDDDERADADGRLPHPSAVIGRSTVGSGQG